MDKNDVFIKKITDYLKKDIDSFIKAVGFEFKTNPFTIYGLNITVYLLKSNRNVNNEEVYEVYSLDCSQNLDYYNSIWKKYLETHNNRYSKFEFDEHEKRGWYDKDVPFPNTKRIFGCFKDLKQLEKVSEAVLSDVEKEEKPNTDTHFIKVDDGWVKFINDVEKNGIERAFNLSWVSSYIHIPNSEYLEYPKWYVSCYLLIDVADKISDKRFYKKAIRPAINKMLFNASLSFHELLIEEKQQDLELQAIRAAISQVMARNTSHNIGAHVMNKLIGKLRDLIFLKDITKNGNYQSSATLQEIHKDRINDLEKKEGWYKDIVAALKCRKAPDEIKKIADEILVNEILLEQISLFNNYVKCRMDYLADVSFGIPLMQTNKVASELFKDLDKVRLLLEHISGLSDFKYEIRFTKNGEPLSDTNDLLVAIPNDILGTQAFYNILENIIRNTAKHSSTKPDTTIFTVNFIDEITIKAKDENGNEKEVDAVDYCKCEEKPCKCSKPAKTEVQNALNEFIAVEVYDNIPIDASEKYTLKSEKDENGKTEKGIYYDDLNKGEGDISATADEISKIDWFVYNQNKKLNGNILEDNKLRSGSLGLVEMDASAAYLRKRPVEFINHSSYDIHYDESWSRNTEKNETDKTGLRGTNCRHFLKAFKKKKVSADFTTKKNGESTTITKTGNALGYRFFLHRPAVVLVVSDIEIECEKKDDLKKEGIWVVPFKAATEDEIKAGKKDESFETHLREGKVYPHEFVVIDTTLFKGEKLLGKKKDAAGDEEDIDLLEHYKTSLPIRVLKMTDEELKNKFASKAEMKEIECNQINNKITNTLLDIWEEVCWEKWEQKLKTDKLYNITGAINIGNSVNKVCHDDKCNCEKDKEFNAVILDHGKQHWNDYRYCKKVDYLDDLSNKAFEKLPRLKTKLATNDWKNYLTCLRKNPSQRHKLRESVISKILAIDERIQNQIDGVYYAENGIKILNHEVYTRSGIIIPNLPVEFSFEEDSTEPSKSKFNLSADNISSEFGEALKKYIWHYINTFKKTDFILIHYSILERVFKNENSNKVVKINDFLNEISKENSPQIVITSGRGGGALTELTSKVRFVNLSSVITSFVEIRSKYYSSYLLHSSRKNNSEN